MSDLLVVSLGTTHGLRVADTMLVEMLRDAGASPDPIRVGIGLTDRLRRGYPVNDLVEALAARRALTQALASRPQTRAVLFSTTTTALLGGGAPLPYAVRLDSPAALNRRGPVNAPVRALERRSLARARLVIALGRRAAAALPPGSAPAEVVPVPIDPSGDTGQPRDPDLAVAYVPDPKTKGLVRLCTAWAQVAGGGRRLEVFGIQRETAIAFLGRYSLPEPPGVTFHGYVPTATFRAALRGARCFVSAAHWEDFGQAPLEALCDGALLVTAPADGPYEALALARELDPRLVAPDMEPASLAVAVDAALQRTDASCTAYRERAGALLEPYRRKHAVQALRLRVLPVLLPETSSG